MYIESLARQIVSQIVRQTSRQRAIDRQNNLHLACLPLFLTRFYVALVKSSNYSMTASLARPQRLGIIILPTSYPAQSTFQQPLRHNSRCHCAAHVLLHFLIVSNVYIFSHPSITLNIVSLLPQFQTIGASFCNSRHCELASRILDIVN